MSVELERGRPEVAARILKQLGDGPMRPSTIRKAIGVRCNIHFNRYYLAPLGLLGGAVGPVPTKSQSLRSFSATHVNG